MPRLLTLAIVVPAVVLGLLGRAQSEVMIAVETGRGEYEAGKFTPGKPEFSYRFEVDEKAGRAKLTEMNRLANKAIIDVGVEYVIVASEDGASVSSSFLVSERRRSQRILTLVGKPGSLATEVILLGEDFFEYCKVSSGRLYLATGSVRRAVSREEDTLRHLLEGTGKKAPEEGGRR